MVNPTGYTALDLIGYTDKGNYSPSANYVKNDLVHYSGNIWRVLIDDTTNVTPSEGANYTLFIGEPSNLVEAAIAPMENTPSTAAYTVGRRLFFNDILYEVIAPIAIGDTLVTYESDPSNANIKVSAKVEEQIEDINSSIQTLNSSLAGKVNTSDIANNLTTTASGKVLDARQGKALNDAIANGVTDVIEVTTPSFSSLPQTYTVSGITANHTLVQDGFALLSNPSAQGSDWTITTAANAVTISGTFSGSTATTVKMTLGVKRSVTAS